MTRYHDHAASQRLACTHASNDSTPCSPRTARRPVGCRWARPLIGAAIACVVALGAPCPAWAVVQRADLVCGEAASDRGIADADLPDIAAPSALVLTKDGRLLYARDVDTQRAIASITKVMTAIVALENANLTDVVTVDEAAATVGESSANLKEGDTLSLEDALRALLIPSGNDAAMAIASSVGASMDPSSTDPLATFIAAMNVKAQELGCTDTVFTNPHGLDFDDWAGDLHSTARDVAVMVAYAMRNDTFRSTVSEGSTSITVTSADGTPRTIDLTETNMLLGIDGNIGVKTGTTDNAGACFAGAFVRDDDEVYTVVLGDPMTSKPESWEDDERFKDTMTLATWYYNHEVDVPAVQSTRTTLEGATLVARATHADWTDKTVDVVAADPEQTVKLFSLGNDVEASCDLVSFTGDVHAGDPAGTLTLSQDGEVVAEVDLVAAEEVAAPGPLEWLLVQFDRLVRTITGMPTTAPEEEFAVAPEV
ncbi:peptidase S11 [Collinsella sp. An2]|nr:peptidase S11 [Collinsella sp. An2]